MDALTAVQERIIAFRDERDWAQFHSPRNLATAIAVEAAELQETMLWKSDSEVAALLATSDGKRIIAEEIADVFIFGLLLCESAGIDPITAIREKLDEDERKYPVEAAKGTATKYTNLRPRNE